LKTTASILLPPVRKQNKSHGTVAPNAPLPPLPQLPVALKLHNAKYTSRHRAFFSSGTMAPRRATVQFLKNTLPVAPKVQNAHRATAIFIWHSGATSHHLAELHSGVMICLLQKDCDVPVPIVPLWDGYN